MHLENKKTARFITAKIYRYFVNDKPDHKRIEKLAKGFYETNYNIETLLQEIFTSDWFFESQNIGVKIKSPIDLVIGIGRSTGVSFVNPEGPLFIQKHLGQMLLNPPNVAGWPGSRSWIDSSTLLFRTRLMEFMVMSSDLGLQMKNSGDVNDQFKVGRLKKLGTKFDVETVNRYLAEIKNNPEQLKKYLLQAEKTDEGNNIEANNVSPFIGQLLKICRTPEYQMC